MATLDRRVRQARMSKLPQLVLGMSPNVGACLQGVAASLWPAFFLSLNSEDWFINELSALSKGLGFEFVFPTN